MSVEGGLKLERGLLVVAQNRMVTGCSNTSSFGLTQSLKLPKNFNLFNIEAVKNPYPDSCLKATFFYPQCGHGRQVHLY